jgi:S1-C subfamily serine protease
VRISDVARRFTVFFGSPDPQDDKKTIYRGTGFLVLYEEGDQKFPYLVTARHVAERAGKQIIVRVNNKDGKTSTPLLLDAVTWAFHADPAVDVAVTPAHLDPAHWEVAYYNLSDRVQPSATPYRVQWGDFIYVIGLFHWHSGQERNAPIVHSGTVAMLPTRMKRF